MDADIRQGDWAILFIDMVGSTQLKYQVSTTKYINTILSLIRVIDKVYGDLPVKAVIKFTGDGAMIGIRSHPELHNAAGLMVGVSETLLQSLDVQNLLFRRDRSRIRVRIGIAYGRCFEIGQSPYRDLIGTAADLAARLCSAAAPDTVLLDSETKCASGLPEDLFVLCKEILPLKGVSAGKFEFYQFQARHVLTPHSIDDPYYRGLIALYPDRKSLGCGLQPPDWIRLAEHGSEIVVAGRTLISWASVDIDRERAMLTQDHVRQAVEKDLRLHLLVSSERACSHLNSRP